MHELLKNNPYYAVANPTAKSFYEAIAEQLSDDETFQAKQAKYLADKPNAVNNSNKPLFEALTPKVLLTKPEVMEKMGKYILRQDDIISVGERTVRLGDYLNVVPLDYEYYLASEPCAIPDDYTAPTPPTTQFEMRLEYLQLERLADVCEVPLSTSTHYKKGRSRLFGFSIPFFQRGNDKWTLHQKQLLIDSALRGLSFGTILATTVDYLTYEETAAAGLEGQWSHKNSMMLLDGQQRLTAFDQFLNNEFQVYNSYFDELPDYAKTALLSTPIAVVWLPVLSYHTQGLMDAYDRLNYGGTVHDVAESAYKAEQQDLLEAFSMSTLSTYADDTVVVTE